MSHHTGEFIFRIAGKNQTRVDIEETAGQCHRVDFVRIQYLDREGDLRVGVIYKVLADTVDVLDYDGIGDQVGEFVDLRGILPAHRDLPVCRVPVSKTSRSDVAHADRGDVV